MFNHFANYISEAGAERATDGAEDADPYEAGWLAEAVALGSSSVVTNKDFNFPTLIMNASSVF